VVVNGGVTVLAVASLLVDSEVPPGRGVLNNVRDRCRVTVPSADAPPEPVVEGCR